MFKQLSIHPRLVAVLDFIFNIVFLWSLGKLPHWWWLAAVLVIRWCLWVALVWLVFYPAQLGRRDHFLSLIVLSVGSTLFLLFVEWRLAWYVIGAAYSILSCLSFWLLPSGRVDLAPFLKPHVRWRFIMSVFGLAGIFQGMMAVISFQILYTVSTWVLFMAAAALATGIAVWHWLNYGIEHTKRLWLWTGIWFVLMLELLWMIQLLPLGYLVSSMILIWCWYVPWLLVRFNLTAEGIRWHKQAVFLSLNAVLFAAFLLFGVRWK